MANALNVKIGADIRQLESAMNRASKSIQDTGKRMSDMGKTISMRITAPLTALAGVAVRSFGIQEKAELQLRAALQANGREVDNLFNRYNAFAKEMQRVTVVGDETTLSMLAQAESFGLSADNAERAVKNSIAMQSAFGVNAQSALRYTAALEEGNATMLTRYIPSLREIDDESERVAEAQRILGNAFSSAEAEAQGSTGQMIQMKNAVGDLMESVGEAVSEAILPFIKRIKEIAETAQNLNKDTIRLGVAIGALVAAIGPAIFFIGKLVTAIGFLISPIGLAIAAISGLIVIILKNFDSIREQIVKVANAWIELYNESALVRGVFNSIGVVFGIVYDGIIANLKNLVSGFKGLGKVIMGALTLDWEKVKQGFAETMESAIANTKDLIESSQDRIQNAILNTFAPRKPIEFITEDDIDNQIQRVVDFANHWKDTMMGLVFNLEPVKESVNEFGESIGRAVIPTRQMSGSFERATETGSGLSIVLDRINAKLNRQAQISTFAMGVANDFTSSFGQGMANVVVQGERLIDTLKNIGKLLASAVIQRGLSVLLTGGLGGSGFFGSAGGLFGKIFGVNDALITSGGDVVKFHPDDNILAMKDFSGIGGGGTQRVEVFGTLKGQDLFISSSRGGNTYER